MRAELSSVSGLGARVRAPLAAFRRWWIGELAALVPRGVRRLFSPSASRLVVDVENGDAVALTLERAGEVRELGRVDLRRGDPAAQLGRDPQALAGPGAERVVRLSPEDVVSASVVLPSATEENLREVLAFEMDRYTPFRAEQVYYDYRIAARDREHGKLRVQLFATPRERLDPILETLGRWGLAPLAVEVREAREEGAAPPASVNLLPRGQRARGSGARSGWNRALAAAAAGLVIAAVAIPLVHKARLVETLRSDVADARRAAETVQSMRARLEESIEEVTFLTDRKHALPAVIDLLDALTRLLPDDTWLLRFELREDRMKIQGESPAASNLISLIESSDLFRDPSFVAPVTQNPRSGQERFVITARIVRRGEPGT